MLLGLQAMTGVRVVRSNDKIGLAYQMLFASEDACDFVSFRLMAVVRV